MLIMNLSVAAVIEGLDTARKSNLGIVHSEAIENFVELWRDYDENAIRVTGIRDLDGSNPIERPERVCTY